MHDAKVHLRPYFFEVFAVANLLLIGWMGARHGIAVFRSLPSIFVPVAFPLAAQLVGGVIVRSIAAAARGQLRLYWARLNTAGWWTDSVRLLISGGVLAVTYAWIKLAVPVLHPRLFDAELWELDRLLFFGLSPNIFFLNLFSPHAVLRVFDMSYAYIFVCSMFLAFGFFLSSPSRRLRAGFISGLVILWLVGAWLYVLVPSLGPAYYFPDIWFAHENALMRTQRLQATLMQNYQNFLRVRAGGSEGVNFLKGVAAFPSLHVGFQTFMLLWFRKLWLSGQVIFAIFLLMIFLGSMITGWHYMIDSFGGLLLAFAAYWSVAKVYRIGEWSRLRKALRR